MAIDSNDMTFLFSSKLLLAWNQRFPAAVVIIVVVARVMRWMTCLLFAIGSLTSTFQHVDHSLPRQPFLKCHQSIRNKFILPQYEATTRVHSMYKTLYLTQSVSSSPSTSSSVRHGVLRGIIRCCISVRRCVTQTLADTGSDTFTILGRTEGLWLIYCELNLERYDTRCKISRRFCNVEGCLQGASD